MPKVFISHSSLDAPLAELLIDLLRDALSLNANDIRCTSVDGYRLSGGAETDKVLRREISDCSVFIGLLSHESIASTYVTFELGARWGIEKHLIPLLSPGLEPSALDGPIKTLNALSCSSASQIHQLIADLATELGTSVGSVAAYQKRIDRIINYNDSSFNQADSQTSGASSTLQLQERADLSDQDVLKIIKRKAAEEHPGDFSTQQYVVRQELNAWNSLKNFNDSEVPKDIIDQVIKQAASEHPDDLSTQLYVVKQQLASWKEMHS